MAAVVTTSRSNPVAMKRTTVRLVPNPRRVIVKRFTPGFEIVSEDITRARRIVSRILALSEEEAVRALEETHARFDERHEDLRGIFEGGFAAVSSEVPHAGDLSSERRLLIGAYFTHEYAIEAAALTNPSMVVAPDQSGLAPGQTRFIMSVRGIGEGHVSSIQFRSGVVDASGEVEMEPVSQRVTTASRRAPSYDKGLFGAKLVELRANSEIAAAVLERLPDPFTIYELEAAIAVIDEVHGGGPEAVRATRTLHWLASSNYHSTFSTTSKLSERVLFPAGPAESNGMEDARFVRFVEGDGSVTYFATYTAYDGFQVLPQLIETRDFVEFRIATLNGASARGKGIALFPRMIGGRYVALGRQDSETNSVMWSDNVHFWHESVPLQTPERDWELMQIGNCGSPIETSAGWLVITHGVGPMRQYALGAILLDLNDPSRVIGHLERPLLEPDQSERDGYVPNVVYSCGSMLAGGRLIVPYGFSDIGTRIATIPIDELLSAFELSEFEPRDARGSGSC